MKIEAAVRRETLRIAAGTAVLTVLMVAVFLILKRFDWTVLTGALLGWAAAVGNFFLMALTVQKVAADTKPLPPEEEAPAEDEAAGPEPKPLSEDAKRGKQRIQLSYSLRMLGLGVIAILGVTLPWFHSVAVLLPMLFPRIVIAVLGLTGRNAH